MFDIFHFFFFSGYKYGFLVLILDFGIFSLHNIHNPLLFFFLFSFTVTIIMIIEIDCCCCCCCMCLQKKKTSTNRQIATGSYLKWETKQKKIKSNLKMQTKKMKADLSSLLSTTTGNKQSDVDQIDSNKLLLLLLSLFLFFHWIKPQWNEKKMNQISTKYYHFL